MNKTYRRLLLGLLVVLSALALTACASTAGKYDKAQKLMANGEYAGAAEVFAELGSYEDAPNLTMYCRACAAAENGDYASAITALTAMGDYKDCPLRVTYYTARSYEDAAGTDNWELMIEALEIYRSVPFFLDSQTRIAALEERIANAKATQYDAAVAAGESGEYDAARAGFRRLGSYRDCRQRITYYSIREDEDALVGSSDQDAMIAVAARYTDMGPYLDCAERAEAMTARADQVVADKYAMVDSLTAEGRYSEATTALRWFGDYGSGQISAKYYQMGEHARQAGKWSAAADAYNRAGYYYADAPDRRAYVLIRTDEDALRGTTDQDAIIAVAKRYTDMGSCLDSADRAAAMTAQADQVVADKYQQVDALIAEGRYDDATSALRGFGSYGNGSISEKYYQMGEHALAAGKYDAADKAFRKAGSYSDAPTRITYTAIRRDEAALEGSADQDAIVAVAKRYTQLGDHSDCAARAAALTARADQIVKDKYATVDQYIASGYYSLATKELDSFGTYGSEDIPGKFIAMGDHALAAGEWASATLAFRNAGSHPEAKDRLTYTAIRKDEAALEDTDDQDALIALTMRYKAMNGYLDSDRRIFMLTARADQVVAEKYAQADAYIADGEYDKATRLLERFGSYGKAQIPAKYYALGEHALTTGHYDTATTAFRTAGDYHDAPTRIAYTAIRRDEAALEGTTDQDALVTVAKRYTQLGNHSDCPERAAALMARADQIVEDKYQQVDAYIAAGEYNNATHLMKNFGSYGRTQIPAKYYAMGDHALAAGKYDAATTFFQTAGTYSDAKTCISYTALRKDESKLASSTDPDALVTVAERYTAMGGFRDCADRAAALTARADQIVAERYQQVDAHIAAGEYDKAEAILADFSVHGNGQIPAKHYAIGEHALSAGHYDKATEAFKTAGDYHDAPTRIAYTDLRRQEDSLTRSTSQDAIVAMAGKYTDMGDYDDCAGRAAILMARADQIVADRYQQVDAHIAAGEYDKATLILDNFGTYGNGQIPAKFYRMGEHALSMGRYDDADAAFRRAGDYEDAPTRIAYTALLKEEAALERSTDQDALVAMAGKYKGMGDHADCAERAAALMARADQVVADKYANIDKYIGMGKYTKAEGLIEAFGTYGREQIPAKYYQMGEHALEAGEYSKAIDAFRKAGDYKDAPTRISYTFIRKDEAALEGSTDQDAYIAMAKRYTKLGEHSDCAGRAAALTARADQIVADKYAQVDALIAAGEYDQATRALIYFGTYGSEQKPAKYYQMGEHALSMGRYDDADAAFRRAGDYEDAPTRIIYTALRREEAALESSTDQDAFIAMAGKYKDMGDHSDCAGRAADMIARADQVVADKYAQVDMLISRGDYPAAEAILEDFGVYGNEQIPAKHYAIGEHALASGQYDKATASFRTAGSYADAPTRITYTAIRKDEAILGGTADPDRIVALAERYLQLGDHSDCPERAAALMARADKIVADKYAQADALMDEGKHDEAMRVLNNTGHYGYDPDRITYAAIRKDEDALAGSTDPDRIIGVAGRYTRLGDFLDCPERAAALTARADQLIADRYARVDALIAEGRYDEALALLKSFGSYGKEQLPGKYYQLGEHALAADRYDAAATAYQAAGSYSDAATCVTYATLRRDESKLAASTDPDALVAMAARYTDMDSFRDCADRAAALTARADRIVADRYRQVDELIADGKYAEVETILSSFSVHGCEQVPEKYMALGNHALEAGNLDVAYSAFTSAGSHPDASARITYTAIRKDEAALAGSTNQDALVAVSRRYSSMGEYLDCPERAASLISRADQVVADKYAKVDTLTGQKRFKDALNHLDSFGSYGNDQVPAKYYTVGEKACAAGNYDMGIRAYRAAGSYSDAAAKATALIPRFTHRISYGEAVGVVGVRSNGSIKTPPIPREVSWISQELAGWHNVIDVASGEDHIVVLCADGTLESLGDNYVGERDLSGWRNITDVAVARRYTVGLRANGTIVVAGDYTGKSYSGMSNITAIDTCDRTIFGLRKNGTVAFTANPRYDSVSGWRNITAISAGEFHLVGLCKDGTVVASGANTNGECNVSGWRNIVAISAGYDHTVGLRANGTVVATGDNRYGQCNVSGWTDIIAIYADEMCTLGLRSDGTVIWTGYVGKQDLSDMNLFD